MAEQLEMQPMENGMLPGPRPEPPPHPDALSAASIMALVVDRLMVQVSLDVTDEGSGLVLRVKVADRMRPEFAVMHQSELVRIRPMGVQPQFQKEPSPF